jgi:anaerobic selenocysteine-containing dehydrogenase
VQPNIGGDVALFQGIAKELIENENIDKQFIEKYTNGFEIFAHKIRETPWDNITLSSGVNRPQINV